MSEYRSLPKLNQELLQATGNQVSRVIRADIHPLAPFGTIAAACLPFVAVLEKVPVDTAVIIFDKESRTECPGHIAEQVRDRLAPRANIPVCVVVKNSMFENWLIADLIALQALPALFEVNNALAQRIAPNKADNCDAIELIRRSIRGRGYDKVGVSGQILDHASIDRIAANSRSFRRFLRCLGHPAYTTQSRDPESVYQIAPTLKQRRRRRGR